MAVLLATTRRWYCPNCPTEQSTGALLTNVWHACPGLRGLNAPMLPVGVKAKVEAREREDYVGSEAVQVDVNGRPVMSVVTTRDDGQDVVVMAPMATGHAKE